MNGLECKGKFANEKDYWMFYIEWVRVCIGINPSSQNKGKSIMRGIRALYSDEGIKV